MLQVRSVRKQMELQMRNTMMKLPKGIRKSEQKLTRMMLFIFGVFFVTYMPGVGVKMVSTILSYSHIIRLHI